MENDAVIQPDRGVFDLPLPYPYPRPRAKLAQACLDYPHGPYRHPDTFWMTEICKGLVAKGGRTVLDVGGGNGVMARGDWLAAGAQITVLDIWAESPHRGPGFVVGDALEAVKIFGERSFDVVQCTEMLEHVDKGKGLLIVDVLLRVAREVVLLTTPCGFDAQPIEAQGNPHQVHVSGWDPEELLVMGFWVYINGPEMFQIRKAEGIYGTPQMVARRYV